MKPKFLSIIGSTGCLGRQTLEVVRANSKRFKIFALGTYQNVELLFEQIKEFKPQMVAVFKKSAAKKLQKLLQSQHRFGRNSIPKILVGKAGWEKIASHSKVQKTVFVSSGLTALSSLYKAISARKEITLATKELIVAEGRRIMKLARKNRVTIVPIDSEHSAIFQCLQGENPRDIEKIILTCSGGPFYGKSKEELKNVTPEQALQHPTWKMGPKISIDSATLMNKGFEVIEAQHLFGLSPDQIEIVIHPESIIHSLVVFKDGSIKAQLGAPDMRIPITYALAYPERVQTNWPRLNLTQLQKLTFLKPDFSVLEGPSIASSRVHKGTGISKKLIKKNQESVQKFLQKKIKFLDIYKELKI